MHEEFSSDNRNCLDLFHFAIAFAGLVLAAGGVVISSLCVVCCGLLGLLWGMAYFAVNNSDI